MGRILVTGGCGYIGSHTMVDLIENGHEVICLDNLSNAGSAALQGVEHVTGVRVDNCCVDLSHREEVVSFFEGVGRLDGIIHFAALKAVGESMEKPMLYFRNNVTGMINLLDMAVEYGIPRFVFSSSCTVYGQPETLPVTEDTPTFPSESPYGRTKQMGEWLLEEVSRLTPLRTISLRYFNPAGAHESARLGESPSNPPLNLIPIITETAYGLRDTLKVYGNDYETRDGTCIRDYIHVMDLARAHTLAYEYFDRADFALEVFNLGTGAGTTVMEAIQAFESSTGRQVPFAIDQRRPGDISAIYANSEKAERVIGWKPQRDIEDIMRTAWAWEKVRRS